MGLYARIFASAYDRFMAAAEKAGMADLRHRVLAPASGHTVEIGAGTGLNIEHYPPAVTELVLTEPSEPMVRKMEAKLPENRYGVYVVTGAAESLPFDDESIDTVTGTLVLCTVDHPSRAVEEIARVLRPGGQYLFLEHVRSDDPKLAAWQDRLHWPWLKFGNGCHCNRDSLATIEASPLAVDHAEHGDMPKNIPIVKPLVWGRAAKPG